MDRDSVGRVKQLYLFLSFDDSVSNSLSGIRSLAIRMACYRVFPILVIAHLGTFLF